MISGLEGGLPLADGVLRAGGNMTGRQAETLCLLDPVLFSGEKVSTSLEWGLSFSTIHTALRASAAVCVSLTEDDGASDEHLHTEDMA